MKSTCSLSIFGHIKIDDITDGNEEILVDKGNAIHYGNISTVVARAISGNGSSFLTYMTFGNGGVNIDDTGTITYRPTRTSVVKNFSESLYSTTYVVSMTNESDTIQGTNTVASQNASTENYEDVLSSVVLGRNEPASQLVTDNSSGVNSGDATATYVFNEIALFAGKKGIPLDFSTGALAAQSVDNFLNDDTTIMLTHVVFHPVQKSKNRQLKITYTLRFQMGE